MRVSDTQSIEIRMMIGYGDCVLTQQKAVELLNTKNLDSPLAQLVESKVKWKFRENGTVNDRSKFGRPKINEEAELSVLLAIKENLTTSEELAEIKISKFQLHIKF